MLAIVLFGLVASVYSAPQFHRHHYHFGPPPFHPDDNSFGDHFFRDEVFDTRRFWAEMAREMEMFDKMMSNFARHFPSSVSSEGVDRDTNEYKVAIPLSDFEEKDIVVKAREGMLMVQAVSKPEGGIEKNYLDIRRLPSFVNVTGSWKYEEGVLKIVFPLLEQDKESDNTTEAPLLEKHEPESREEPDSRNENADADVGVLRGDRDKEIELLTNEISKQQPVEATTYAVDLKDEVEFVPVRY